MFFYVWPVAMIVCANTLYQICAKAVPSDMHPLASIVITYLMGAVTATILYFILNRGGDHNILKEFSKANWASFVFGMVLVGLEVGFIYAYKAGWQVSVLSIVTSCFLAITLIIVGFLLYHEMITWNKIVGVAICMVGLVFINLK